MDGKKGNWRWWWTCMVALLATEVSRISAARLPIVEWNQAEMDALYKKNDTQKMTAMDYITKANLRLDKTSDKNGKCRLLYLFYFVVCFGPLAPMRVHLFYYDHT